MNPPLIRKIFQMAIDACCNKTGRNNISFGMTVCTAAVCHITKAPIRHQSAAIGIRAEMIVRKTECRNIRSHFIILRVRDKRFLKIGHLQQFFQVWFMQNRAIILPIVGACHNYRIIRHIHNGTITKCRDKLCFA